MMEVITGIFVIWFLLLLLCWLFCPNKSESSKGYTKGFEIGI